MKFIGIIRKNDTIGERFWPFREGKKLGMTLGRD
jgi:hypothetical protein